MNSKIFPESNHLIFKGSQASTIVPLVLTRTMYSQVTPNYLFSSLYSTARTATIGYSIMRETIQKGTQVPIEKVLEAEGLKIKVILRVNTYGFFIKQDATMSILDAISKISALAVLVTAICGILMGIVEKICFSCFFKNETDKAIAEVHTEFTAAAAKPPDSMEMLQHDAHANEHPIQQ